MSSYAGTPAASVSSATVSEEKKSRPSLAVIAVIALVALSAMAFWGVRNIVSAIPTPGDLAAALEPQPYEDIGPVVVTSIRDLANLTTVEVVEFVIIEKGTDSSWLDWARGDSLRLFAVANIGAGVDLGQVTIRDVSVDEVGVVEISVPAAEIQYVAVDSEATQILEREIGLLTKGDPRLETDARQVADQVLVQSALEAGILEKAEANARTVLTDFLLSLGYQDVIVEFES